MAEVANGVLIAPSHPFFSPGYPRLIFFTICTIKHLFVIPRPLPVFSILLLINARPGLTGSSLPRASLHVSTPIWFRETVRYGMLYVTITRLLPLRPCNLIAIPPHSDWHTLTPRTSPSDPRVLSMVSVQLLLTCIKHCPLTVPSPSFGSCHQLRPRDPAILSSMQTSAHQLRQLGPCHAPLFTTAAFHTPLEIPGPQRPSCLRLHAMCLASAAIDYTIDAEAPRVCHRIAVSHHRPYPNRGSTTSERV
ncbi:hypothetical protein VTI74DRAFT_7876 [Chaetomium olivicolor]